MSKKDKKEKKAEIKKPKVDSFPKAILLLVELHAMACVTASYILAFINHMTVVENLSITIVGQIIAPLICYLTGSVVSNIFEKNRLTFSTPISAIESGVVPMEQQSVNNNTVDETYSYNEEEDNIDAFEFESGSGKGDE